MAPTTEQVKVRLRKGLDVRYQDDKSPKPEEVPADKAGGAESWIPRRVPLAAEPHEGGGQELRNCLIHAS